MDASTGGWSAGPPVDPEVVRVTLQDRDGAALFEGEVR
jgi:hypothetical protein